MILHGDFSNSRLKVIRNVKEDIEEKKIIIGWKESEVGLNWTCGGFLKFLTLESPGKIFVTGL